MFVPKSGLIIVLFILLFFQIAHSQEVALVLSGGGSKGISHIGVLKALEENNIPVDYIVGTSMGAVVGAMYSSGYTSEEIEGIMTSNEVNRWATGKIDSKHKNYFRKRMPDATMLSIPFDFKGKIVTKLPSNIISPILMDFALMEIFAPPIAAAGYDFDSLYIPFHCVAADIDLNRAVVFRKGNLSEAVRASMTFPFYFKPIKVNGTLMFDGGMYNNFPVDIAIKDFDPDIIIGCKAAGNYESPDRDDIISQLQNMLMENTDYTIDSNKGIVIAPELPSTNILDFSKAKAFIDSGYVAANKNMPKIKKLIKKRIDSAVRDSIRKKFVDKKPPLIIDTLFINGVRENQVIYFQRQLMRRKNLIGIDKLKKEYFNLVADEQVQYIYPSLKYNNKTDYFDLYLDVDRAERFIARFGINISSSAVNEAFVGLQYNHLGNNSTRLLANAYFGRFYSSFKLNGRFDFATRLPFYLELDMTYNHYDFFKNTTYFFEDKEPSFLIENDNHTTLSFGFPATNKGKLVTGISIGQLKNEYYQTNTFSRLDTADRTYFDIVTPFIHYELNSLNRKQFASSGAKFSIMLRYVNGREKDIPGSTAKEDEEFIKYHDYLSFKLTWENYFISFKWLKLGFYGELYLSNQQLFNNYTATILSAPAFQPIPESKVLFLPSYRAHNYAASGLINIFPLLKNVDLRVEAYIMQPYRNIVQDYQTLKAKYEKEFSDRTFIGSVVFVYNSPLGPLSLNFNYYDRKHDKFSFLLNFGYMIFNGSIFD